MDDWADPIFARRWDAGHLRGNPIRGEQIAILLTLVEPVYVPGTAILDLGIGSGIIAEAILDRMPDARLVGIDASPTFS